MPNLIKIFLNLGKITKVLKDVEQTVEDLIAGKNTSADFKLVLEDLSSLFKSGLISIPGISTDQIAQVIADLEKTI
jgi:hypothetical protein